MRWPTSHCLHKRFYLRISVYNGLEALTDRLREVNCRIIALIFLLIVKSL